MEKVTYNVMDYNEWDKLVQTTYGKKSYEVVAEEQASNDSTLERRGIKRETLDEWDMESLSDWISGKKRQAPGLYQLMTDMANNGIIEEGNYLITICW